jgi:hypothetical protein
MVNFYVEFNFQVLRSSVLTHRELNNYLSFVDKDIKRVVEYGFHGKWCVEDVC